MKPKRGGRGRGGGETTAVEPAGRGGGRGSVSPEADRTPMHIKEKEPLVRNGSNAAAGSDSAGKKDAPAVKARMNIADTTRVASTSPASDNGRKAVMVPTGRGGGRGGGGRGGGRGRLSDGSNGVSNSSDEGREASASPSPSDSSDVKVAMKPKKEAKKRPNWFLAMRLACKQLRANVQKAQDEIKACDDEVMAKLLSWACVPLEKLHITLHVFRVDEVEDMHSILGKVNAAVAEAVAVVRAEDARQLTTLNARVAGVGHFRSEVAFADIHFSDKGVFNRLWLELGKRLQALGMELADDDMAKAAYTPHLTVMKLSRVKGDGRKEARRNGKRAKIDPGLLKPYAETVFGEVELTSVQILSMTRKEAADGYYHCHSEVMLREETVDEAPGSPPRGIPRMASLTDKIAGGESDGDEEGSPRRRIPRMVSVTAHVAPASPEPTGCSASADSPAHGIPRMASVTENIAAAAAAEQPEAPASPVRAIPRMASVTAKVAPASPEVDVADTGAADAACSPARGIPRMASVTSQVAPKSPEASPRAGVPRMASVTSQVAPPDVGLDVDTPGSPVASIPRMDSVTVQVAPQSPEPSAAAAAASPVAGIPRMDSVTLQVAPRSPEPVAASPTPGIPRMDSVTAQVAPTDDVPASPVRAIPRMASVTAKVAPASPEVDVADTGAADAACSPARGIPRMASVTSQVAPKSPDASPALAEFDAAYTPRVAAMLRRYGPPGAVEKTLDAVCKAYAGREEQLMADLVAKYGPEPAAGATRKRRVSFKEEDEVVTFTVRKEPRGGACSNVSVTAIFGGLASILAYKLIKG